MEAWWLTLFLVVNVVLAVVWDVSQSVCPTLVIHIVLGKNILVVLLDKHNTFYRCTFRQNYVIQFYFYIVLLFYNIYCGYYKRPEIVNI